MVLDIFLLFGNRLLKQTNSIKFDTKISSRNSETFFDNLLHSIKLTKAKKVKLDAKSWPSSPSERVRVLEVKFSSRASPVKVWGSRDTADTGRLGFYLSRYMISRIFIQYFDIQSGKHRDQH